jgi:hypothetical protein
LAHTGRDLQDLDIAWGQLKANRVYPDHDDPEEFLQSLLTMHDLPYQVLLICLRAKTFLIPSRLRGKISGLCLKRHY